MLQSLSSSSSPLFYYDSVAIDKQNKRNSFKCRRFYSRTNAFCAVFFLVCFCSFLHFDRESISFISFWFSRVFAVLFFFIRFDFSFFTFRPINGTNLFAKHAVFVCASPWPCRRWAHIMSAGVISPVVNMSTLRQKNFSISSSGEKKKKTKRKKQSWLFFLLLFAYTTQIFRANELEIYKYSHWLFKMQSFHCSLNDFAEWNWTRDWIGASFEA